MAKGSCHGCGCELPSDCCWFCLKCVGTDTNARLIEMAISDLEQVPGGKLHNPRVLTAIGCLMSLRTLSSGVSEGTMPEPTPSAKGPDLHVITTLEVVGYNESRRIDKVMDPGSDRVLYLAPVSGSTKASIDVRISNGSIFRIPVDEGFIDAICGTKLEGADSIAKSHQDSSNESVWKEVLLIQLMLVKEGVKTPKEVVELLASQLVPRDTKVPSHVKG